MFKIVRVLEASADNVYLISRHCCPFLHKLGYVVSPLEEVTNRVSGAGQETDLPRRRGRETMPCPCSEEGNRR